MARNVEDKFQFYPTPEQCAEAAAPVFAEKRWRWHEAGIPSQSQILDSLNSLRRSAREWHGSYCASGRLVYHDGLFGFQRNTGKKFDRKTFDPTSKDGAATLVKLRQAGRRRRFLYSICRVHNRHLTDPRYRRYTSSSFDALSLRARERGIYLDLGCGDSADALVASRLGYDAYGLDLFPPSDEHVKPEDIAQFIQADVAERIPFPDSSVAAASSHAMIDLIEPDARLGFYSEVYRVLTAGGLFSLFGIELVNGHGFLPAKEHERCLRAGFERVGSNGTAAIFQKSAGASSGGNSSTP